MNEELKFLGKFTKKNSWGWVGVCGVGGGGGRLGGGGQDGCTRRIEVFVKIQKKNYFFFLGGGGSGVGLGEVRVDVNKELKF